MTLREIIWLREGKENQAFENDSTLVVMIANIFGKEPKPLDTFKPWKDD